MGDFLNRNQAFQKCQRAWRRNSVICDYESQRELATGTLGVTIRRR